MSFLLSACPVVLTRSIFVIQLVLYNTTGGVRAWCVMHIDTQLHLCYFCLSMTLWVVKNIGIFLLLYQVFVSKD